MTVVKRRTTHVLGHVALAEPNYEELGTRVPKEPSCEILQCDGLGPAEVKL